MSDHIIVASGLCAHPDFSIFGRRSHERYVIIGLIAGGCRYLSVRKALEYIEKLGYTTNRFRVNTAFKELIEMGWIYEVEKGSYFKRIGKTNTMMASKYNVTEKLKDACLNSKYFYSSISAYYNHKPIRWEDDAIVIADNYENYWRYILPAGSGTDNFINSLAQLEANSVHFDRESAMNAFFAGDTDPKTYMPHYYKAQLGYYPLKTGRLQSNPHVYLGKALVPFITPFDDKDLKKGTIYCLDYRSQELCLLADKVGGRLKDDIELPGNIFNIIHSQLSLLLQDTIGSVKQPMYAMTYGSNGRAMAKELTAQGVPFDIALDIANDFHKEINILYPEIGQYQREITNQFVQSGSLTNVGGVTRYPECGDLTNSGRINRSFANRVALSHMIQGEGAQITRDIVTKSSGLGFSRLHIPIHDGFVFYSDKNIDLAVSEATQLMKDCSGIDIPVKMEWMRHGNKLEFN